MNWHEQITAAKQGDLTACRQLVEATQPMVLAVAQRVLRDLAEAQDAAQEAYLRAFRRLHDLEDPAVFPAWLRRIAISCAHNLRRRRRHTLLQLDHVPEPPVLDDVEQAWTAEQRRQLAQALLILAPEERRLCDRYYHGRWPVARLAAADGITEPAMRKRLQRIRDKLRKEIEMIEQASTSPGPTDLPHRIAELLARPRLVDLPENPVGRTLEMLQAVFPDYQPVELPEIIDLHEARQRFVDDPVYIDPGTLHRIDERQALRYDLSLPMLLHTRYQGQPLRRRSAGKVYRQDIVDATHLEAFHQAELFVLDERERLDSWTFAGQILRSLYTVLPDRTAWMEPVQYPMCSEAWALGVDDDGRRVEVMAWGVYTPAVVAELGADPDRHTAFGAGYGLERLAGLRFGIDDVRKIEAARVG